MAKALHRLGNLELMRLAKGVVQSVIVPWQDLLNIRTGHPGPPGALAAESEDFQVGRIGRAELLKHLESLLLTRCHAKDLWLSGPRPHIGRDLDEWDP